LIYTELTVAVTKEGNMNAHLTANAEALRQTTARLARMGLIIDRTCLSQEQRRAAFALQCVIASGCDSDSAKRVPIGFAYPNAR
jgi:hypothetical protein